jgi:hypothetical protein
MLTAGPFRSVHFKPAFGAHSDSTYIFVLVGRAQKICEQNVVWIVCNGRFGQLHLDDQYI